MLQSKYLRVSAVATVAVAALFLLVEGVIRGDWIQILWIALFVIGWITWWRDKGESTSMRNGHGSRLRVLGQVSASVALGTIGVVLLSTQDAVFTRVSGGLLIASSICFGIALYYRRQAGGQIFGPPVG